MAKATEKMDSLAALFRALTAAYPDAHIVLLQNAVVVEKDNVQIVGYSVEKECVQLNRKTNDDTAMPITHCHPESYSEIYDAIVFYLDNHEKVVAQQQKERAQYRQRVMQAGIVLFVGIMLFAIIQGLS